MYIALAILLTIQAIPMLGMFMNLLYIYAIVGVVVSIITLFLAKNEGRSIVGAVLGTIGFCLAIISGTLFHITIAENFSVDEEFLAIIFMVINWIVVVVAAIFAYINAFSKKHLPIPVGGMVPPMGQRGPIVHNMPINSGATTPVGATPSPTPQHVERGQATPTHVQQPQQNEETNAPIAVGGMKFQSPAQTTTTQESASVSQMTAAAVSTPTSTPIDTVVEQVGQTEAALEQVELPIVEETYIVPALRPEEKQVPIHKPENMDATDHAKTLEEAPISNAGALSALQDALDEETEHLIPEITENYIVPALKPEEKLIPMPTTEQENTPDASKDASDVAAEATSEDAQQTEIARVFAQFKNQNDPK